MSKTVRREILIPQPRAQVWQWVRHGSRMSDGKVVPAEWLPTEKWFFGVRQPEGGPVSWTLLSRRGTPDKGDDSRQLLP